MQRDDDAYCGVPRTACNSTTPATENHPLPMMAIVRSRRVVYDMRMESFGEHPHSITALLDDYR